MIVSKMVLVAVWAAMLGLASPLWAQNADSTPPAITPTTGKFVFTFTLTVTSALPKNGVVSCNANATVNEASSGQSIFQKATGIATLSGGKWTCKATMPYSWTLATPTSDTVLLSDSVEMDYGLQVTATNGTGIVVVPLSVDKVNQNIGSVSVPLNGSTTNESVTATI